MAQELQPAVDDRRIDAFRPIRQRSAADEVIGVLVDALSGALYQPGDLLPRERDLAERLEVSRTVVREAIQVLRRAGVVTVRRGRSGGVVVASLANLPRVAASLHGETHATMQSLLEARRPLELAAALLAAERATDEDLARLLGLVVELEALMGDPDQFLSLDVRFHLAIAETARSPVLEELLKSVIERLLATLSRFPVGHVGLERALENQRSTLDALQSRDPARVTSALDRHLGALEEQFLGARLRFGRWQEHAEG
jgi:GntR family transcriptional repressor for pyruvate dehydrogenase complex